MGEGAGTLEMKGQGVLFSSARDDWETPREAFAEWHREFHFTVDGAASRENALVPHYYGVGGDRVDALSAPWEGRVFCNPPYGAQITPRWVRHARLSVDLGSAELVVLLLPARTDTRWFHEDVIGHAEVRFIRGRLRFGGPGHGESAPFPSMLAIYRGARNWAHA